jgi:hypothetical protein
MDLNVCLPQTGEERMLRKKLAVDNLQLKKIIDNKIFCIGRRFFSYERNISFKN